MQACITVFIFTAICVGNAVRCSHTLAAKTDSAFGTIGMGHACCRLYAGTCGFVTGLKFCTVARGRKLIVAEVADIVLVNISLVWVGDVDAIVFVVLNRIVIPVCVTRIAYIIIVLIKMDNLKR